MSMACFAILLDRYGLGRLKDSGCVCTCAGLGLSLPESPRLLIIPRQRYNATDSRKPSVGSVDAEGRASNAWGRSVPIKDELMRLRVETTRCCRTRGFGSTEDSGSRSGMSKFENPLS